MYQRAIKLRDTIVDAKSFVSLAEDQLEALSVAINALYLVDEKSAWIFVPVVPDAVRFFRHNCELGFTGPYRAGSVRKCRNTSQNQNMFRANTKPKLFT